MRSTAKAASAPGAGRLAEDRHAIEDLASCLRQPVDVRRVESPGIASVVDDAAGVVADDLPQRPRVESEDRKSAGHRLDHTVRTRRVHIRGQEEIGRAVQQRHVVRRDHSQPGDHGFPRQRSSVTAGTFPATTSSTSGRRWPSQATRHVNRPLQPDLVTSGLVAPPGRTSARPSPRCRGRTVGRVHVERHTVVNNEGRCVCRRRRYAPTTSARMRFDRR